jgi:hypothetical protein
MTSPQLFAIGWGVLAICLGFAFARFPRFMVAQYEQQRRNTPLVGRRELTPEARQRTVVIYRVGGILFMIIGVCVGIAAGLGALK